MYKQSKIKVCLHIGFHKTASTFLQDKVFSHINEINFLGRDNSGNWFSKNRDVFLKDIIYMNIKSFESKYENINIVDFLKIEEFKINILSEEKLSSLFYCSNNLEELFKRIKFIFKENLFELKIFYFIRNQKDLIVSRYSENSLKFKKFNSSIKKFSDLSKQVFPENINFSRDFLINWKYFYFYQELNKNIKHSKIKFLIYEEFVLNREKKILEILDFFEIKNYTKINFGKVYETFKIFDYNEDKIFLTEVHNLLKKIIGTNIFRVLIDKNNLLKLIIKRLIIMVGIIKNPIRRNREYDQKINNYYIEDNIKLEHHFKIDLKKFNYY